jgi:hypothetical protein
VYWKDMGLATARPKGLPTWIGPRMASRARAAAHRGNLATDARSPDGSLMTR